MMRNQVIVCFSTISWDYLWQRHQEFMSRFGRAGNRVLFVEPIGIRMPKWEDRGRVLARLRNRTRTGGRGLRAVAENVWAVDPLVNPFQQVGFVHRRNVSVLTGQLRNALAQLGGGEPVVWIYAPTPLAREVTAELHPRLVIYDCVDAYSENPKGVFPFYAESERALVREADMVLTTSPRLMEHHHAANPHTCYVPPGADYARFADEPLTEPRDMQAIPQPRLEFFGGIDERVDLALLTQLARTHPAWHFVFPGVVRTDAAELRKLSNMHFPGQIAHAELPAYLHHAAVLLLPYVRSVFTQYIQPAKLFECLATGKPIAALGLPVFQEYSDVMYVASDAAEYGDMVQRALDEKKDAAASAAKIAARRARAQANRWDARFDALSESISRRLDEKQKAG